MGQHYEVYEMSCTNFPGLIFRGGGGSTEVSDTTYAALATKCAAIADGTLVYLRNSTGDQYAQLVVSGGVPYLPSGGRIDFTKYDGVAAPFTTGTLVNTNSHGSVSWVASNGLRASIPNVATTHKFLVRVDIPILKPTNPKMVSFAAVARNYIAPLNAPSSLSNGVGVCAFAPTTANSLFAALMLNTQFNVSSRYIIWGTQSSATYSAAAADDNPLGLDQDLLFMGATYWCRSDSNQTQEVGGFLRHGVAPVAGTAGQLASSTSNISQILGHTLYPLLWVVADSGTAANSVTQFTLKRFEASHI